MSEGEHIEKYLRYHENNAKAWEIDTHLDAAVYFANLWGLDKEQRCYLAFLTACCETTPTAFALFSRFPDISVTADELVEFANENRGLMQFQYDVRWILYVFGAVLDDYKSATRGGQYDFLSAIAYGRTREERCRNFCELFGVRRFGTYVFFLYTELVYYLCGIDIRPALDVRSNHSVRSGLIYALGKDGEISCVKKGSKPTEKDAAYLNGMLRSIVDGVRGLDIIQRHKEIWAIETTLCTYNKFNHGRRYIGFYKERQRKEIERAKVYINDNDVNGVDISYLDSYHAEWGSWNINYEEAL